jgi:hypothetical protein
MEISKSDERNVFSVDTGSPGWSLNNVARYSPAVGASAGDCGDCGAKLLADEPIKSVLFPRQR